MKEITQSESIQAISKALLQAQIEVDRVVKNAKNPHFKSTYADITAVIDAVKPALNNNGITFLQLPCPSENDEIRITTRLLHESGEWIDSTITIPLSKKDAQGYGSGITYARRYSLAAIMGLPQEDDDGNNASGKHDKKPQKSIAKAYEKPISASGESFERLSSNMKEEAISAANAVEDAMPDVDKAIEIFEIFHSSYPENEDMKIGTWSKISSSTRSAMNRRQKELRGAQ